MKFKVLNIEKRSGRLIIEVETKYGKTKVGCPEDYETVHVVSGKPQWMHHLRTRLEKKYKTIEGKAQLNPKIASYMNEEIDTKDVEDYSNEALSDLVQKGNSLKYDKKVKGITLTEITAQLKRLEKIKTDTNKDLQDMREERIALKKELQTLRNEIEKANFDLKKDNGGKTK